jgi:predicted ATPase
MSQIGKTGWYVLTSAPSSGMTTLANALRPHVDVVFPEAAREYIDEARARGVSVTELRRDEVKFQKDILDLKLRNEAQARKDKLCIFERGIPDSIPYWRIAGVDPAPLWGISRNRPYAAVFFLEPLPYERDYARTETNEEREELVRELPKIYRELGYRVVPVPAVSVEERVRFVLAHIL